MCSETPKSSQLSLIENTLVRRDALNRLKRFQRLDEQAQNCAKKIILKAERDASTLRSEGMKDGITLGFLWAFEEMAGYLSTMDETLNLFRERIGGEVARALKSSFSDDDIVYRFTLAWDEKLSGVGGPITLYLTEESKRLSEKLHAELRNRTLRDIIFERSSDGRTVMECGDLIFTMDLETLTSKVVSKFVHNSDEQFTAMRNQRDLAHLRLAELINRLNAE